MIIKTFCEKILGDDIAVAIEILNQLVPAPTQTPPPTPPPSPLLFRSPVTPPLAVSRQPSQAMAAISREPSNRSISPEPSKTPPQRQRAIAEIGSPIQTRSRVAPFTSTPKRFSHEKPNFETPERSTPTVEIEIPASTGAIRKRKRPQKTKKKTKKQEYGIDDITYTDHEKKEITNRYGRQAKFFGTKKK